jgi:hypothetical protein
MINDKKEENSPFIENISEIYKKIDFYKKGAVILTMCSLFQTATIFSLIFANPIVIQEKSGERIGYVGVKKELTITQKEIKDLVRRFIRSRYEWQEFNPELISKDLEPFVKSGLSNKMLKKLNLEKEELKGQKLKQYVGKIKVEIDEDNRIVGTFDKIIRIGNIPLLSEAQVLIGIVKGLVTKSNKLGLYINSVVNYESK